MNKNQVKKSQKNSENIAISVKNVSKTFRIPHEKVDSLRSAAVSAFKKQSYEEFKALDNVSFEVKKGEFFGIIGRNGSGKSTLLKILAGIYKPNRGKVKIDGMISPFLELGIGFNPELSGRDNVYLNATVLGMTKKQIDEKFDNIVKFSELERFIDQKLKNYSSGMQVRLAFSVSIHANRDILLMDEVLAVGDSNFQSKCLTEFNKYRDMGRTVVIVTHDISVVQRYCDRAMLLQNGEMIKIGNADDVVDTYNHKNMDDVEKILNNQTIKSIDSNGLQNRNQKIVTITDIHFLDKNGSDKSVFATGEYMKISIGYEILGECNELNFGIGLHSAFGGQIFGYNTQMDEYRVDFEKKHGEVIIEFEFMPILQGEYYVNIACWGNVEQNHYDFLPRCKTLMFFAIGNKRRYRGFFDISHKWNQL